jgi:exodeoxyribonuclease-1
MNTLLWHDYESFGADTRFDRPAQFAYLRTSIDLEPIGTPECIECQPPLDYLPDPEASLITGLDPLALQQRGLPEPAFARAVWSALIEPGTCGVGFNSIRFDDELTRHLCWRNFLDPYEREWANGNTRWDLIDAMRLAYALRPNGINWPKRDDGAPSFKLEHLAQANRIEQLRAHDAASDVSALLDLARLLKRAQPKLYEHAFALRHKHFAAQWIDLENPIPVLHVSQRIGAERGCLAMMLPIARHPAIAQRIIAIDLGRDISTLRLEPEQIVERLLSPGLEPHARPPLKLIHLNRAPMLAPINVLKGVDVKRIKLDVEHSRRQAQQLLADAGLVKRVKRSYELLMQGNASANDADAALYDGFVADPDRFRMGKALTLSWQDALRSLKLDDKRLQTLLLRARARWLPECLSEAEHASYIEDARTRLLASGQGSTHRSFATFDKKLEVLPAGTLKQSFQRWRELVCEAIA